jgi:HEAT repeat protein
LEIESSVPSILPLLGDEDSEVRLAAVAALGKIGSEQAKQVLRRLADDSDDEALSDAAAEALAEAESIDNPMHLDLR